MATIFVRRIGNTLVPDGDLAVSELSKLPFNKGLRAEVKRPRNLAHLKLYWEICHRIAEAVGSDKDTISNTLLVATGHCTTVKTKSYGVLNFPKSISFAALDQTGFSEVFERMLAVIWDEWSIERKDLLEGLGELIDKPDTRTTKKYKDIRR